jgi:integrase
MTEVQARKVLNDILESVGEGPIRVKAVREFFFDWLAGKQLATAGGTYLHYKKAISKFIESLGARADKALTSIRSGDIEQFREVRTKCGVSASTVKADLKVVRSVLDTARRHGLILHNPAEAVDLPRSKGQERDIFTPSELGVLLAAAPAEWKTAILLGYYLGARLGDVVSLRWNSVDLAAGVIFYTQGKTGRKVEVPIHTDLEKRLFAIAGDSPRGFLCPTLATLRTDGRKGLSNQFAGLMTKAGIDRRQVQSSKNRKFSQLSFHSLRHSFASALANARISADVRMKLTGHKSVDVHRRYTHMELEPLRQAIAALPRLNDGGAN